jgi:hypothetical protein
MLKALEKWPGAELLNTKKAYKVVFNDRTIFEWREIIIRLMKDGFNVRSASDEDLELMLVTHYLSNIIKQLKPGGLDKLIR